MIVIIDYNVGNIRSVCNAFRHIGWNKIKLPEDMDLFAGLGVKMGLHYFRRRQVNGGFTALIC